MNTKPVLEVLNLSKRYTDFQLQINNLKFTRFYNPQTLNKRIILLKINSN